MALTVRPMTASDLPEVVRISAQVAAEAYSGQGTLVRDKVWTEHFQERWQRRRAAADTLALVADLDGELIACAFVEASGETAELGGAYCARPDHGAGLALVRARLNWARSQPQLKRLRTVVYRSSPTLDFWLRNGFHIQSETSDELFGQYRELLWLEADLADVRFGL